MNDRDESSTDYRSFLLLDEISKNHEVTQRDLSKNLGFALGLINSYLKNLISKGYVTVSSIPRNRYTYYLTPTGFSEKTRLTYKHLQNFTNLYRVARRDFSALFHDVAERKINSVAFCGVDEVTEIAFLSLKEAGLELAAIFDANIDRKNFLGYEIIPIADITSSGLEFDLIIITSFESGERLFDMLRAVGVDEQKICGLGVKGWLKRISN